MATDDLEAAAARFRESRERLQRGDADWLSSVYQPDPAFNPVYDPQVDCYLLAQGYIDQRERIRELEQVQANLAIMVRRLITAKKPISQKTKDQCWDYLQRKGLQGSVLRDEL